MSSSPEPVSNPPPAVDENVVLQPEEGIDQPPPNQLLARTITLFKMVRIKGKISWAAPSHGICTHEFWRDVEVKGYVASLNGSARFLLQGGYWDITYGDLHHEYMKLGPIVGLSVEKAKSWRNGTEYVMWLHTALFAYALQEPDDDYKPAWNVVVASWGGVYATSLIFQRVSHVGLPARWWANKNCWKALQEKHGNTLQIEAGGGNSSSGGGGDDDDDDDKHNKGDDDDDDDNDDQHNKDDGDDENDKRAAGTSSRKRRRGAGEAKAPERRQREPASKVRKDKGKSEEKKGAGRDTRRGKGKGKAIEEAESEIEQAGEAALEGETALGGEAALEGEAVRGEEDEEEESARAERRALAKQRALEKSRAMAVSAKKAGAAQSRASGTATAARAVKPKGPQTASNSKAQIASSSNRLKENADHANPAPERLSPPTTERPSQPQSGAHNMRTRRHQKNADGATPGTSTQDAARAPSPSRSRMQVDSPEDMAREASSPRPPTPAADEYEICYPLTQQDRPSSSPRSRDDASGLNRLGQPDDPRADVDARHKGASAGPSSTSLSAASISRRQTLQRNLALLELCNDLEVDITPSASQATSTARGVASDQPGVSPSVSNMPEGGHVGRSMTGPERSAVLPSSGGAVPDATVTEHVQRPPGGARAVFQQPGP